MSVTDFESYKIKEELRSLIDDYASLGDQKKISEQMGLFTKDATYTVYVNGALVANNKGTDIIGKEFNSHASQVKTYFTMNGQHLVKLHGDTATGVSFSQLKMIRQISEKDIITDYSAKYDDKYVLQNGKWLISERIGYFEIIESRELK